MDKLTRNRVRKIIDSNKYAAFIACSGGGSGISDLFANIPGASKFLVGSIIPYARIETDKFLGFRPKNYVCRENAINLAHSAYVRAAEHLLDEQRQGRPSSLKALGLGMTCTVATTRALRGGYRIHLAITTPEGTKVAEVNIGKVLEAKGTPLEEQVGDSARETHLKICDEFGLDALSIICGRPPREISDFWESVSQISEEQQKIPKDLRAMSGVAQIEFDASKLPPNFGRPERPFVPVLEDVSETELREVFFKHPIFNSFGTRMEMTPELGSCIAYLCGSFNPMHDGHRKMAEQVKGETLQTVYYSTTADSVHKAPLTISQLLDRAASIRADHWDGYDTPIVFSQHDPLFIDKARNYPGSGFVVGIDTINRMLEPRWYSDGEAGAKAMLKELYVLKTVFYVFGRVNDKGVYEELDFKKIPKTYKPMFKKMDGRWDISSTQIREKAKNA